MSLRPEPYLLSHTHRALEVPFSETPVIPVVEERQSLCFDSPAILVEVEEAGADSLHLCQR